MTNFTMGLRTCIHNFDRTTRFTEWRHIVGEHGGVCRHDRSYRPAGVQWQVAFGVYMIESDRFQLTFSAPDVDTARRIYEAAGLFGLVVDADDGHNLVFDLTLWGPSGEVLIPEPPPIVA